MRIVIQIMPSRASVHTSAPTMARPSSFGKGTRLTTLNINGLRAFYTGHALEQHVAVSARMRNGYLAATHAVKRRSRGAQPLDSQRLLRERQFPGITRTIISSTPARIQISGTRHCSGRLLQYQTTQFIGCRAVRYSKHSTLAAWHAVEPPGTNRRDCSDPFPGSANRDTSTPPGI